MVVDDHGCSLVSQMNLHRRILLTVLCSGVALAASPLAQAQDAPSATLQELSKTTKATPIPSPEKPTSGPSLEISAGTPAQKPAPAAEQTPSAEELATPVAKAEKKPSIRKHATSAAKPKAAELPVAGLMSLSAAKAVAVSAPRPEYSYQAKRAHITGSGVCVVTVDTATGNVTSAMMEQSTGNTILDKSATDTFRRWRFKPGTVSQVRVPITFQ
jgi:TonB family protein